MATLVLSAVGTTLGGPLGGALGALVGNQLDRTIAGSPKREGPRLKELAVTTSSYGTPIASHYGRVRAPGSVIWATSLTETQEKSGGGKTSPSVTAYSYSASFAVALASRPIKALGRIWADGNLLRGAGGDLKVGGALRIYNGHGDQDRDPLIASDRGPACPAFRNVAYCVFEDLQLGDFGNRVPSLTFEIVADDNAVSLAEMTACLSRPVSSSRPLTDLIGFTDEGGPLVSTLGMIDQLYPMICDGSQAVINIGASDVMPATAPLLPQPSTDLEGDGFGELSGKLSRRRNDERDIPDGLRYYDVERDYQPGLQRAEGRAQPGRSRVVEFPGTLPATKARQLLNSVVQRASRSGEQLMWRIAEIDPAFAPGRIVTVPGHSGSWRIEGWEWRTSGVELDLLRLPPHPAKVSHTDAGAVLSPKDIPASPTALLAFELPWDGMGSDAERRVYVAASSSSDGWTGAALYAEAAGALAYLQPSGSRRSVVGTLEGPLGTSQSTLFDRHAQFTVRLASEQFALSGATMQGLAEGRNQALVGEEVLQFSSVASIGSGVWRLSGLLRGRGGTEPAALTGHRAGAAFVLLDDKPVLLDPTNAALATTQAIAAIGLADSAPVLAPIANPNIGRKPLTPVHPRANEMPNGSWWLAWTRRARGAWNWPAAGEVPLHEQAETYLVGVGDSEAPALRWNTSELHIELPPDIVSVLRDDHAGERLWVRQVGTFGISDPVLLRVI